VDVFPHERQTVWNSPSRNWSPSRNLYRDLGRSAVLGVDLVVVTTSYPERAIALYAGRLGFPMLCDRTSGKGSRRIQFACGNLLIEVTSRSNESTPDQVDRLWVSRGRWRIRTQPASAWPDLVTMFVRSEQEQSPERASSRCATAKATDVGRRTHRRPSGAWM
jgi:hypothetical protein